MEEIVDYLSTLSEEERCGKIASAVFLMLLCATSSFQGWLQFVAMMLAILPIIAFLSGWKASSLILQRINNFCWFIVWIAGVGVCAGVIALLGFIFFIAPLVPVVIHFSIRILVQAIIALLFNITALCLIGYVTCSPAMFPNVKGAVKKYFRLALAYTKSSARSIIRP